MEEAALWFFDQGLNPISKPLTGNLEPDLLDPLSKPKLYIEAKRYKDKSGLGKAVSGVRQVADTMQRLLPAPFNLTEAVLLVFREDGPLLVLPPVIMVGEWRLLTVVVDLSPGKSGSKQKSDPIEYKVADLIGLLGQSAKAKTTRHKKKSRKP